MEDSNDALAALNMVGSDRYRNSTDSRMDCRTISFLIQFLLLSREMWYCSIILHHLSDYSLLVAPQGADLVPGPHDQHHQSLFLLQQQLAQVSHKHLANGPRHGYLVSISVGLSFPRLITTTATTIPVAVS